MARRAGLSRAMGTPSDQVPKRAATRAPDRTHVEAMIAKTVKLPISVDEKLRRYCFEARRTGQDVMLDAIDAYLNAIDGQTGE